MTELKRLVGPAMLTLAIAATPMMAFAFTGQEYARDANVTLEQARAKAVGAVPGKITDQELEKEKGGSGLRYSFDIKTASDTREVGIDAKTGELLENSVEGPNAD